MLCFHAETLIITHKKLFDEQLISSDNSRGSDILQLCCHQALFEAHVNSIYVSDMHSTITFGNYTLGNALMHFYGAHTDDSSCDARY